MNSSNFKPVEKLNSIEEHVIVGIIAFIFSFGSLGNLAICFVYKKVQLLPRLSGKLVINLAICDVLLCLQAGFMIHGVLSIRTGGPSKILCDISGYIRFVLTFVSFAAVSLIMVKRYLTIAPLDKEHLCKFASVNLVIALPWVYHLCLGIAPLVGWSHYTFSYGKLACYCRTGSSVSFSILVGIISMLGPLVVSVYCSIKIFGKLKEIRKLTEPNGCCARKREEIRGSMILFGVIVNYIVCAVPFITVNLLEAYDKNVNIPLRVDMAVSIIGQLMPVINPIIFGFGNEKFRKALQWVINREKKRLIHPEIQEQNRLRAAKHGDLQNKDDKNLHL